MGNIAPFKIKVNINDYETREITIKGINKISELKQKLSSIQSLIELNYLQLYKGDQFLEDSNTVSSYKITAADTLIAKSSREGEFLVFFCDVDNKVPKLVTKEDKLYDAYFPIRKYFLDNSRYGFDEEFYFKSIRLYRNSTFGEFEIFERDKIIVKKIHRVG